MSAPETVASGLIEAAGALVRGLDHPVLRPFLDLWPVSGALRARPASSLPVLAWTGALGRHAVPATRRIVGLLAEGAASLEWRQTYTAADFGAAFLDGYGWTELIGLGGPAASGQIACGFLLLGPQIHYPDHAHEAEEAYIPLSGTALWSQGGAAPAPRAPGEVILHESRVPHAMRTEGEPLLALYLWRGDLTRKARPARY